MNCQQCSKVIPDGFVDCPWCGAAQQATSTPPTHSLGHTPSASTSNSHPLQWIGFLASFSIFCFLQYVGKLRIDGELTLANSAEFLGRCTGTFVLAAIFVFLYDKIRRRA